ncbi:hypothetical protein PRIPAC_80772 [Pristionchus pacificus]|uniref:Uncharacterized protein n=1 Tax=Pristionchus pacificus TaxID=54126 RepID=A0A2A6C3S4_PRIPA|nr:hypothetical protein PRIPAC_80772 [Pristionchus pacificus]|eukprot:PDM72671.1 hypothetical protein PRIPAC_39105 [Pristionchus pacificus]
MLLRRMMKCSQDRKSINYYSSCMFHHPFPHPTRPLLSPLLHTPHFLLATPDCRTVCQIWAQKLCCICCWIVVFCFIMAAVVAIPYITNSVDQ